MSDFFAALTDPGIPFLRLALLAGLLASIAFGVVGTYVAARRISYIAGAISHCVLGGIGAACYFRAAWGWTWLHPLIGALASALIAAVALGLVSLYARQREDTVIGAMWSIGMAIGLIFLAKTPGYVDAMSYLFGNILLIAHSDLWIIAGLDAVAVGVALFYYNKLLAVCFDEEFARLRGIHVERYYLLLLCLTALTVVLLVSIVGIVLVIALLTLPAAVAGLLTKRLWCMMIIATAACALFTAGGIALSYPYDLPSGPVIILFGSSIYLVLLTVRWLFMGGRGAAGRTLFRNARRKMD